MFLHRRHVQLVEHSVIWFSVTENFCSSGSNSYGQLGLGDTINRGDDPFQMGDYLDFVNLGDSFNASQLAVGQHFTCALSLENTIKCWGQLRVLSLCLNISY